MKIRSRIFMALVCLIESFACVALPVPGENSPRGESNVTVSIVNCYPGPDIYELEGHTAIRISGVIDGMPVDQAINYGLFDFNAPNFVYRFVKGETDYMVGAEPWELFESRYIGQGRRMVQHDIQLDSAQTMRLLYLLARNLEPEQRVYRYNYVKDNCALRPLRIIEAATGDSIILPEPQSEAAADKTFREVMRRYHANYPWYQFGIDLALGSGIDYPITPKEKAFAPVVLDAQLAGATMGGKPFVKSTAVINEGHDATEPATPGWLTPLTVCWVIFAMALAITISDFRHRRVTRWFDTVYFAAEGIAGLIITFLIFVSVHEATSPNWLYLWLNPLCLIVPAFIWLKKCKIVVFSYQIINFAALLIMACCWNLFGQEVNPAFLPLICVSAMRAISYISITYPQIRQKH